MRPWLTVPLAAAALMALAPASGLAARSRSLTFGSTLRQLPTDYDPPATCDTTGANVDIGPCTRVAVRFAGTGAVRGRDRAPVSGVIRRVRIRAAAPGTVRVTLVRLRSLDYTLVEGEGKAVSKGKVLTLKGRGLAAKHPVESFRVGLRVRKGDYLALEGASTTALACRSTPDFEQLIFEPPLKGSYQRSSGSDDCTLLVQATIKPRSTRRTRRGAHRRPRRA